MGSQVNEKKKQRERKKERKKRKKREGRERKKRVRSLDEWIQQVRKTRRQVFFTKLTMQNIEEFCFISIVKRGHHCYLILTHVLINF